jgi:glutathione S-transferase
MYLDQPNQGGIMSSVTIYGFAGSTYTRTARMVCAEKDIAYELEPVDYGSDSHAEVHPFRRMPALQSGSVKLYEALAITSYVDAVGSGPSLQPDGPAARALMLQWISAVNDYVYPDVVRALLSDEGLSDEAAVTARERLAPFNAQLADSEWLAGDAVSLADLFLAPIDAFSEEPLTAAGALDGFDGLVAWRERVRARPSFAATAS